MNISNILQTGTQIFGRTVLKTQKHSPEILVGAGIVGVVVAGVMVARATLKLDPVVSDFKDSVDVIDHVADTEKWSDSKRNKELAHVYGKGAWELVKLYGPPVTLAAASVACILGGTHILKQRNVALAAAYKVLEKSYTEYRSRVAEEFGEEVEGRIYRDHALVYKLDENGKYIIDEAPEPIQGPDGYSMYARSFDAYNPNWKNRADANLMFITSVQRYLDQRLRTYGHVFLNEAYDILGFERTRYGAVVGWVYGGEGVDNYIDFGIDDPHNIAAREFVQGETPVVILDFNVDGTMWDKI